MKHTTLLLFAAAMMLAGCYPSDVLKKIPDGEFQKFIAEEYDNNGDHKITKVEALAVTYMHVGIFYECKNLEGIQYFENLEEFSAENPYLQSIDLSKNSKIKKAEFDHMRGLQELKLNPQIEEFIMRYQMPDKLEFTSTAELRTYINYDSGKLKELGFTEAPKLELLTVDGNQLSELDLSNFPELKSLSCDYNNLTTLDLSANPKLEMVSLHNNPMLKEVWLKKGQVIDGINVNRDNYYKIDAHVEIKYKD